MSILYVRCGHENPAPFSQVLQEYCPSCILAHGDIPSSSPHSTKVVNEHEYRKLKTEIIQWKRDCSRLMLLIASIQTELRARFGISLEINYCKKIIKYDVEVIEYIMRAIK